MNPLLQLIRCMAVGLGMLLAAAWFPTLAFAQAEDADKKPDAAAPTDPDAEKLAKELRAELVIDKKQNPKIHGYLIVADPDAGTDLQVTVTIVVDKDQQEIELDAIREVIEKTVEKTAYKLDVKPHPVAMLLLELKKALSDDAELKDCRLDDVEYTDDAGVTKVLLRGLILQKEQRAKMTELGNRVLVAVYGDDDATRPVTNAGELELLEAPDAESIETATKFTQQLIDAVKKNPKSRTYHGANVAVYRDPKSKAVRFAISLIIDKDQKPAAPQAEVEALAAEQLPKESYDKIVTQLHPVKELTAQLRKRAEAEESLQQSCVEDLYFEFQEGDWVLQLAGAFTKPAQKEELINLANEVLQVLYAEPPKPVAKADALVLFKRDEASLLAEQDLKEQFRKAVLADAKLYGASLAVSLDPCAKKTRFRIEAIVDQSQEDAVVTELEALATRRLPPDTLDKSTILKHPAIATLKKLREVIAESSELVGSQVDDVVYVMEGETLSFEMIGTLTRYTQRLEITQRCNQVLKDVYTDTGLPVPVARAQRLVLPPLTPEAFVERLRSRIEANKALIGCQVPSAVFAEQDGNIGIQLIGQVAHSRQRAAVITESNGLLADEYGDNSAYRPLGDKLQVVFMPTAKVLAELQQQLQLRLNFDGCQITAATYVSENNSEFLELSGRLSMAEQREVLTDWANGVLDQTYGSEWPRVKIQMELLPPSAFVGTRFFTLGLGSYVRRDFAAAEQDFLQAIVEAPARVDYKYWHIASLIAQGRIEPAYARLRPLTILRRRTMHDEEYSKILYTLENVQGPVRWKLVRLEDKAFIEGTLK
ncbi:MAG: hypothetical protein ACKV2Q_25280 [Planctomycetaceae bacterium]